jgi:hypothetical protein
LFLFNCLRKQPPTWPESSVAKQFGKPNVFSWLPPSQAKLLIVKTIKNVVFTVPISAPHEKWHSHLDYIALH